MSFVQPQEKPGNYLSESVLLDLCIMALILDASNYEGISENQIISDNSLKYD